jgi:hypothetical protein
VTHAPTRSILQTAASKIQAGDPWGRLSSTVYLDAQAVVLWFRLGVFEKVMAMLPTSARVPRFQIQDTPYQEAVRVLARSYQEFSRQEIGEHLRNKDNLHVDDALDSASQVWPRVLQIQQQVKIQEMGRTGMRFDDNQVGAARKHLGEAETLAVIEALDPHSAFVTGDRDAFAVASDRGYAVPVRPLAFLAGVIGDMAAVSDMWEFVCEGRGCSDSAPVRQECQERLACTHLTPEAAARGVLSDPITEARHILTWGVRDLDDLLSRL